MNTHHHLAAPAEQSIVYVRPVLVSELPKEVQDQADGAECLYAVHNADGERLALVREQRMAFELARHHDLSAVHVH